MQSSRDVLPKLSNGYRGQERTVREFGWRTRTIEVDHLAIITRAESSTPLTVELGRKVTGG